eukprot:TRINITY_DN5993_c0_g1_i12.p1 TRINITY_DN5993_c0_g1~~TRINITY_DN5993_c0_g1_i12.p1  ORF type:complete len:158 (-),score=29.00 TRINITY_DN5993_c0_g1_i12:1513-1986(-)
MNPIITNAIMVWFSNSLHLQAQESVPCTRVNLLPKDIMMEILAKIPAPVIDTSNPFSRQENCTFKEPAYATSFSSLLPSQPLPFDSEETTTLQEHPQTSAITQTVPPLDQRGISLEKISHPTQRKPRTEISVKPEPSSSHPKTRSFDGKPSPLSHSK